MARRAAVGAKQVKAVGVAVQKKPAAVRKSWLKKTKKPAAAAEPRNADSDAAVEVRLREWITKYGKAPASSSAIGKLIAAQGSASRRRSQDARLPFDDSAY